MGTFYQLSDIIDVLVGSVLLIFLVFCVVIFVLFVFVLCHVLPIVASVFELSILDCPYCLMFLKRLFKNMHIDSNTVILLLYNSNNNNNNNNNNNRNVLNYDEIRL